MCTFHDTKHIQDKVRKKDKSRANNVSDKRARYLQIGNAIRFYRFCALSADDIATRRDDYRIALYTHILRVWPHTFVAISIITSLLFSDDIITPVYVAPTRLPTTLRPKSRKENIQERPSCDDEEDCEEGSGDPGTTEEIFVTSATGPCPGIPILLSQLSPVKPQRAYKFIRKRYFL